MAGPEALCILGTDRLRGGYFKDPKGHPVHLEPTSQGLKHSPTICHGLIQTAPEKREALDHLQYIDDIIVWGNTAEEVFEKGEKIIQILLKAGFAI